MDNVKKVVVKSKGGRTLEDILSEAFGDLDGMVDGSIKNRILGLTEEAEAEEPVVEETESVEMGISDPESEEVPEDLLEKLKELLAR